MHQNEIVQYIQSYKYQDIKQGNFRNSLQGSTDIIKNDFPKTAHTFFAFRSILSYFLGLNCYNFGTALTKSIKLQFLKVVL